MRILLRACLLVETRWQSRGVSVGGHALAVKPAKASCARIAVRWRRRSSRPITKQAFAPPPPFEGGNFRQRPNISRTNLNFRPVRAKKTTAANIARVAPLEPLPPCHHNVEHAPATRGNGNGRFFRSPRTPSHALNFEAPGGRGGARASIRSMADGRFFRSHRTGGSRSKGSPNHRAVSKGALTRLFAGAWGVVARRAQDVVFSRPDVGKTLARRRRSQGKVARRSGRFRIERSVLFLTLRTSCLFSLAAETSCQRLANVWPGKHDVLRTSCYHAPRQTLARPTHVTAPARPHPGACLRSARRAHGDGACEAHVGGAAQAGGVDADRSDDVVVMGKAAAPDALVKIPVGVTWLPVVLTKVARRQWRTVLLLLMMMMMRMLMMMMLSRMNMMTMWR